MQWMHVTVTNNCQQVWLLYCSCLQGKNMTKCTIHTYQFLNSSLSLGVIGRWWRHMSLVDVWCWHAGHLGLWLLSVGIGRRTSGGGVSRGCGWNDRHFCCYDHGRRGLWHVSPSLVTFLRVLSQIGERSLPSSLFILQVAVVRSLYIELPLCVCLWSPQPCSTRCCDHPAKRARRLLTSQNLPTCMLLYAPWSMCSSIDWFHRCIHLHKCIWSEGSCATIWRENWCGLQDPQRVQLHSLLVNLISCL